MAGDFPEIGIMEPTLTSACSGIVISSVLPIPISALRAEWEAGRDIIRAIARRFLPLEMPR